MSDINKIIHSINKHYQSCYPDNSLHKIIMAENSNLHCGYKNGHLYRFIHFKILGYTFQHFSKSDIILNSKNQYLKYIIPELLDYYNRI